MDTLVEECLLENIVTEKHDHIGVIHNSLASIHNLVFELTFEEEFKTYELVVRKESLLDSIFALLYKVPLVKTFITQMILAWRNLKFGTDPQSTIRDGISHIKQLVRKKERKKENSNLEVGGRIRVCINMFDEFKKLKKEVKTKTIQSLLSILDQ